MIIIIFIYLFIFIFILKKKKKIQINIYIYAHIITSQIIKINNNKKLPILLSLMIKY